MSISKVTAFFSYAHKDDTFGFLTDLRNDLCAEYNVLTGDELDLFFDRDTLEWGDRWKESIAGSIDTASLFIPVLSPNYFGSSNCVLELNQYLEKAKHIGTKELVLPLLLTEFGKGQQSANPKLLEEVLSYQYRDISKMRLLDRGCGAYKTQLNELALGIHAAETKIAEFVAKEIIGSNNATTNRDSAESEQLGADGEEDDDSFIVETMAILPDKILAMAKTLDSLSEDIDEVGAAFANEEKALNKPGLTPKEALPITARLADKLNPVAARMETDADAFALQVNEIDPLIRQVMEFSRGPLGTEEADPMGLANLTKEAKTARGSIELIFTATTSTKRLSRALYKPLKTIERATTVCLGAYDTVISWGDLIPAVAEAEPAPQEAAE